jgi:poly-gamma-glutamate capsule biosynthesis protein CapA/YwtB (metallophosphatase superfamily)
MAVGDILMHGDVKQAATDQGGFGPLWVETRPLFLGADLVLGNLETPIAPLMGQPGAPYVFNAPADLPEALRQGGFTLLSTANNHAYDQDVRGLVETQTRLAVAGIVSIGSGRDQLQAMAPRILERNGLRIAFLAWTDLINLPRNRAGVGPWVNRLDVDQACEAVSQARAQADAVVVSLHWGQEDQHEPTPRQRAVAASLFGAGADLILGHHPHVLQPLESTILGGRRVAVAYSLGNFISNQDRIYDAERMPVDRGDERDGAAVVATFVRTAPGQAGLEKIGYIPLWTENNWRDVHKGETKVRDIRVVRLDLATRQIRPWLQRRERIREMMGRDLELATQ